MRALLVASGTLLACSAAIVGLLLSNSQAAGPAPGDKDAAVSTAAPASPFVVHEWGTFTSFSGSDGVPVGFQPNNSDLPQFVYHQGDENSKSAVLRKDGTVSMETPVLYFYTEKEMRAAVRVDFPRGWITEWYPFAALAPKEDDMKSGQPIRWNFKLVPNESPSFPRDEGENHYYQARATDAVPLQVEFNDNDERSNRRRKGDSVIQREKFLFYRGVGKFPPPVGVRALGDGKIEVTNHSGDRVRGLVLVSVHGGKISFQTLSELEQKASTVAMLTQTQSNSSDLAAVMVKNLTAAGLYEKEARAMVKTWDANWFHEEGSRLLYLVPRSRTDELLPLTVEPKPTQMVRVLVGRHDFLTPEQETEAERLVVQERSAAAQLQSAQQELLKLGRFSWQAREMASKRLEIQAVKK